MKMINDDEWPSMPVSPDLRRYIETVNSYRLEERRMMLRFAPMLCRCQRRYDWRFPEAPQVDCVLHTTVMLDRDGEWI